MDSVIQTIFIFKFSEFQPVSNHVFNYNTALTTVFLKY